jgi:hypothetical protein
VKSWFFENTNRIEKPLARWTKKRFTKIRSDSREINTNFTEIKRNIKQYLNNFMPTN